MGPPTGVEGGRRAGSQLGAVRLGAKRKEKKLGRLRRRSGEDGAGFKLCGGGDRRAGAGCSRMHRPGRKSGQVVVREKLEETVSETGFRATCRHSSASAITCIL